MAKSNYILIITLFLYGFICSFDNVSLRDAVEVTLNRELGVVEETGNNDGERVEEYLSSVGLNKGAYWCAAFVSWVLTDNFVANPKSGWSPSYFPSERLVYQRGEFMSKEPEKGDVFGIYFASKKRVAHVGFIIEWNDNHAVTIEGNSNPDRDSDPNSRNGGGVNKKFRLKNQIYQVSDWIN